MLSTEYLEQYELLLRVLVTHQEAGLSETGVVEASFKSSLEHWRRVYRRAIDQGFGSVAEEIRFFKEVKPAFVARIEYYTYRYHALLFVPAGSEKEIRQFWERELRKIEKFYEANKDFCRYIQQGDTARDEEYFLRAAGRSPEERAGEDPVYDPDSELTSSGDRLVTRFRAYELYGKYIYERINPKTHQQCKLFSLFVMRADM